MVDDVLWGVGDMGLGGLSRWVLVLGLFGLISGCVGAGEGVESLRDGRRDEVDCAACRARVVVVWCGGVDGGRVEGGAEFLFTGVSGVFRGDGEFSDHGVVAGAAGAEVDRGVVDGAGGFRVHRGDHCAGGDVGWGFAAEVE